MPASGLIYAGDIAAPPMEFLDERGRPAGIHIELIKAIEQYLGVPIAIRMMPRAEATAAVQSGCAHLTTLNRFNSREPQFDFLAQTVRTRLSVLLRSNVRRVTGLNDLAGLRITTIPGSYTHEILLKLPPAQRPELILVGDRDEAAQIGADGGAHGMAGSGSALVWLARQQRQTDFVEVPFETIIMNFATRHGCGPHMASIGTAVQALRDQGVVDAARERWSNPDDGSLWQRVRWFAGGAFILLIAVLGWNRTLRRQVRERTHDVSEALTLQQRLTTQAESATRAKSAFLATMSHEIRTPLNAVIATASLLEQTPLTAEQRELVDVIKNGGDSLLSVVSDVLDFSKIEADKLELDSQPFDVRSLMSDTVALVERLAVAKGLGIHAEIDPNFPRWVLGDINRLRQVLLNLLSNATKFTERGSIGSPQRRNRLTRWTSDADDFGERYRCGDSKGSPVARVRAFHAGGFFDHATLRWNRARPRDQPAPGPHDGWHASRDQHGCPGIDVYDHPPCRRCAGALGDPEPAQRRRPVVAPASAARRGQPCEHAGAEEDPD